MGELESTTVEGDVSTRGANGNEDDDKEMDSGEGVNDVVMFCSSSGGKG